MSTHAHAAVLCCAKVHHTGGWDNGNVTKTDAQNRNLSHLMRPAEEDGLRLVLVQPGKIAVHPALNVSDAADNSLYYVVEVGLVWVECIYIGQLYDRHTNGIPNRGLDDFPEKCRVDREQLWPKHRTLGNNQPKTTGWRARVLDGDRLGPILKVGLESRRAVPVTPTMCESLRSSTWWYIWFRMLLMGLALREAQRAGHPLSAEYCCALE